MTNAKILMIAGDFVEDNGVMVPFQALEWIGGTDVGGWRGGRIFALRGIGIDTWAPA